MNNSSASTGAQEEFFRGKSLGQWGHWQGEGGVEKKVFPCLTTDRR